MNVFKKYIKLTGWIHLGIVITLLFTFILTYIVPYVLKLKNEPLLIDIALMAFFLLLMFSPCFFIITFIQKSFSGESKFQKLIIILHAYFCIIIVFSTLYFTFIVIGDFKDQQDKTIYYQRQLALVKSSPKDYSDFQFIRKQDNRAFKGMSEKIWTGVDNPDYQILNQICQDYTKAHWYSLYDNDFINGELNEVPLEVILKIAEKEIPWNFLIKFQRQKCGSIFCDCIYFSVITIATLGYGDISPNLWYVKLASIVEVICGFAIFVFAINFLFISWQNSPSSIELIDKDSSKLKNGSA